jgi:hypothetical protein
MSAWSNISGVQVRLTSGKLIVITGHEKFCHFMWQNGSQVAKVNITFMPTWDTDFGQYLHHTLSWFPAHIEDGNVVWTSMDYSNPSALWLENAMKQGLAPWTLETQEKIHQLRTRRMSHEDFVDIYC